MIFYHGTSKDKWALIQKEGVLWGYNTHIKIPMVQHTEAIDTLILPQKLKLSVNMVMLFWK